MTYLDKFFDGLNRFGAWMSKNLNNVDAWLKKVQAENMFSNLLNGVTGSHMTNAEVESSELSLSHQQILNEQEWERKQQFYEMYESPSAMVRQYKDAGLNPMLLGGSGAGASATGGIGSAGSAPASTGAGDPSALFSLLSGVGNMMLRRKELDADIDVRKTEAQTHRMQAINYGNYLDALTRKTGSEADFLEQTFGVRLTEKDLDVKTKMQNLSYIEQLTSSEQVRQQLMSSGIRLNDASTAATLVQKGILEAQSKYSDQYFKAVADYQRAVADVEGVNSSVYKHTLQKRKDAAEAALSDVIIRAGFDARIFDGEAFEKSVSGTMTKKDKTELWAGLVKTIIGAGAAVGAVAMRSANAVAPVSYPGVQPTQFSYSPTMY